MIWGPSGAPVRESRLLGDVVHRGEAVVAPQSHGVGSVDVGTAYRRECVAIGQAGEFSCRVEYLPVVADEDEVFADQ